MRSRTKVKKYNLSLYQERALKDNVSRFSKNRNMARAQRVKKRRKHLNKKISATILEIQMLNNNTSLYTFDYTDVAAFLLKGAGLVRQENVVVAMSDEKFLSFSNEVLNKLRQKKSIRGLRGLRGLKL